MLAVHRIPTEVGEGLGTRGERAFYVRIAGIAGSLSPEEQGGKPRQHPSQGERSFPKLCVRRRMKEDGVNEKS